MQIYFSAIFILVILAVLLILSLPSLKKFFIKFKSMALDNNYKICFLFLLIVYPLKYMFKHFLFDLSIYYYFPIVGALFAIVILYVKSQLYGTKQSWYNYFSAFLLSFFILCTIYCVGISLLGVGLILLELFTPFNIANFILNVQQNLQRDSGKAIMGPKQESVSSNSKQISSNIKDDIKSTINMMNPFGSGTWSNNPSGNAGNNPSSSSGNNPSSSSGNNPSSSWWINPISSWGNQSSANNISNYGLDTNIDGEDTPKVRRNEIPEAEKKLWTREIYIIPQEQTPSTPQLTHWNNYITEQENLDNIAKEQKRNGAKTIY